MAFEDKGEIPLDQCDEMNIPVVCFLSKPTDSNPKWRFSASNFMPRRESVVQSQYNVEADTKEEIIELVNKHVVPLYEAALNNLKLLGQNYYWEDKTKEEPDYL